MIEVKNLKKEFKVAIKEPGIVNSVKSLFARKYITKHALKDVTLKVDEGEILGLIGSNGAGKTTLVKILAGIIHASGGEAKVLGHDPWSRNNEYRKQMALIMGQKAQVWWDLPAADSFLLLKEIYQIPEKNFKTSLEFLSDSLGIKDQLKTQVRKLSLGERMKVELMAALLHRPKVVYLDEPTIGLDLTAQKAIRHFLLNYRKEFKPAMILTSHYMEDIEKLCKRIAVIRQGEIVYDGLLESVKNKYRQEKIIVANLKQDEWSFNDISQHSGSIGEVIQFDQGVIKTKVLKENMSQKISYLLDNLPVKDLSIEEPDIADMIEKIMLEGHHA
jgi:ABC-2 type transport system ATP-binding protein